MDLSKNPSPFSDRYMRQQSDFDWRIFCCNFSFGSQLQLKQKNQFYYLAFKIKSRFKFEAFPTLQDQPALKIWQLFGGIVIGTIGYPFSIAITQSIFSKIIGPRPQVSAF